MEQKTKLEKTKPRLADQAFEIICKHKDTHSSNLSQVFDSYGCNTLEANAPIIRDETYDKMLEISKEQQLYAHLSFKSKSATDALDGRLPRTRNRQLRVVEIDNQVLISAGPERDRSPVDPIALDNELDQYMEVAKMIAKANGGGDVVMDQEQEEPVSQPRQRRGNDTDLSREDLDRELDELVRKRSAVRAQKKGIVEQAERQNIIEEFEKHMEDEDEFWP